MRIVRLVGAAVIAATAALATPTPAHAGFAQCTYFLYRAHVADSCFEPNGDVTWVGDVEENGWSAEVLLEASYPADGLSVKTRVCQHDFDFPRGEQGYTSCDYDHKETHCVRWWVYERNIDDPSKTRNYKGPTPWIGVDDGKPGNCIVDV
jgi:hypothetical protein